MSGLESGADCLPITALLTVTASLSFCYNDKDGVSSHFFQF